MAGGRSIGKEAARKDDVSSYGSIRLQSARAGAEVAIAQPAEKADATATKATVDAGTCGAIVIAGDVSQRGFCD
jgi:hypothetical protein